MAGRPICHNCQQPLSANEKILELTNGWKYCEECQEDLGLNEKDFDVPTRRLSAESTTQG